MRPPDPSSTSECPQNSGLRGEPFQRHRKDLKIWASARFAKDDESSYWAHMNGTDQMGDAAGAPAPPVQPAALAAADRRYKMRSAKVHEALYASMQDERLKDMIGDLDPGVLNGQGPGRRAWLLIVSECDVPMTDLRIRLILTEYNVASIKDLVGISDTSVTDFNRALNSIITRLPGQPVNHKPTENDRVVKILECIGKECPHPALALEATRELQASAGSRRFERAVGAGHVRDPAACVAYFDEVWRTVVTARAPAHRRLRR